MKTIGHRNDRGYRNAHGQVLVEHAAFFGVLVLALVAIAIISVDAVSYITYSARIRTAAQAAARANATGRTLYETMLLTDPAVVGRSEVRARATAEIVLRQLAVPGEQAIEIPELLQLEGAIVSSCRIRVEKLPIPFAKLTGMPTTIAVEGVDALGFGPARIARLTVPTIANGEGTINQLDMSNFTGRGLRNLAINFPFFQADHVELQGQNGQPIERNLGFYENSHPGEFPGGFAPKYETALSFHALGKAHNVEGKSEAYAPH